MRWAASDVSPSSHLAFHIPTLAGFCLLFVLCCCLVLLLFALLCFCFLFCKCFGIPNSPRSLDLDDRQGLIASSAMQQKKKPCRAIRLVKFPRDGQAPSDCASGSDAFPPKSSAAARSGIDKAMGPWLCPQEVHMDPECVLITRRTYPLRMCYCVTKLQGVFTMRWTVTWCCTLTAGAVKMWMWRRDKFWPVVTMCRRCSPFPEGQNDGNSPTH